MNQAYYSEFYPLTTGAKGTTVPVVTTGEIVAIQADLNTLGDSVVSISSDTILAKGEKGPVIIEYSRLTNEFNALKTKANALGGFTTQVSNAQTSYNTLTSYLTGLTPAWDNTALDTTIVAATYRTNWIDAYEKVATLNAAIHGLPGAGGLAYRGSVQFNDGSILTSGGGATATDINYQTSLGVAATIASQGTGATANNLTGLNASEGAKLTGIDIGATAGDNIIRNGNFATDASQWVVASGAASRVASTTAGDLLTYMRATSGVNLIAANNGDKIPVRPGARLYYSFAARADVQNVPGGGVNARRMYLRQTFYNAAGSGVATVDIHDATKASVNGESGGCGTAWQLHTCSSDVPANAASVKVEMFPLLGSTGAGKQVDFTQVAMAAAQAGADKTVDQLRTSLIADKSTSGDNLIRNGDLTTDGGGWLLNSVSWGGVSTAWSNAGGSGSLRHTGATSSNIFPNCRPDRTAPNNVADMADVIAGKEPFTSFQYRSDGTCTASIDHWFYNSTGGSIASAIGAVSGNANTAGVLTSASGKVTVPAGATKVFYRVVQAIGAGTYVDMTSFRSSHADAGATVGAQTGINLLDAGGASLTDALIKTSLGVAATIASQGALATLSTVSTATITDGSVTVTELSSTAARLGVNITRADGATSVTDATAITSLGTAAAIAGQGALATAALTAAQVTNTNISIGANGALSGAGGGTVTIGGLGYTGALNATVNIVTTSASAPASPVNGDIWVDTSSGSTTKVRVGGAWVVGADVTASVTPSVTGNTLWPIAADVTGTTITTVLPETRVFSAFQGTTDVSPTTAFTLISVASGLSLTVDNTPSSTTRGNVTMGTGTTSGGTFTLHAVLPGGGVIDTVVTVVKTNAVAASGGGSGATYAQDTIIDPITSTSHATIGGELQVRSDASSHIRVSADLVYGVGYNKVLTPMIKGAYATSAGGSLTDLWAEEAGGTAYGQTDTDDAIPGTYTRAEATFTMPAANTDYFFKLLARKATGSGAGTITPTGTAFTVRQ